MFSTAELLEHLKSHRRSGEATVIRQIPEPVIPGLVPVAPELDLQPGDIGVLYFSQSFHNQITERMRRTQNELGIASLIGTYHADDRGLGLHIASTNGQNTRYVKLLSCAG